MMTTIECSKESTSGPMEDGSDIGGGGSSSGAASTGRGSAAGRYVMDDEDDSNADQGIISPILMLIIKA